MYFAKKVRTPLYRLGEIFLDAGIISADVLDHGLFIAKRAAMPLGRVLVMSGHVSELDVECALQTQSSVRDGSVDANLAKDILRFAHVHQISMEQAYQLNGVGHGLGPLPTIGKLFLAAGLVGTEELDRALAHSRQTGLPLGRAMLSLSFLDEKVWSDCLEMLILIRDRHVSFFDAVRVLKSSSERNITIYSALKQFGVRLPVKQVSLRLGELLVQAGLLSRIDSLIVCELGIESSSRFGDLLVEYDLARPLVVEAACQLQSKLSMPMFSRSRAKRLLGLVHSMDVSLDKLLAEMEMLDRIVDLLRAAGVIDERTMRDTAVSISDFEYTLAEALIQKGFVTPEMSRSCLLMIQKIERREVSYEKALEVLRAFKSQDPYEVYCAQWAGALVSAA